MHNINLAVGYHNIPNFHHLNQSLTHQLTEAEYQVPSPFQGLEGFREAIVGKLGLANGVTDLEIDHILVTQGATQALYLIVEKMLSPEDEILLPLPAWGYFRQLFDNKNLNIKEVQTLPENHYKLTPEELFHAVTPDTKMLILTHPGNPGGGVYTKEELNNIARIIKLHPQLIVLADEVYELLIFDKQKKFMPLAAFKSIRDQVISVNGFSKSFGLTSWRIGYVYSHNAGFISKLTDCQKINTFGLPIASQHIGWTALQKERLYGILWQQFGQPRRDQLFAFFEQNPNLEIYLPDGAYFLFPNMERLCRAAGFEHSAQLPLFLSEKYNLEVADGAAFGMPFHYRINFMQTEGIIREAIIRFTAAFEELEKMQ